MKTNSLFELWLKKAKDKSVAESLLQMKGNDAEIQDAFCCDLEFGTGGLRGVMSAGTNRMNVYTVFRATSGVAKYMQKHNLHSCAITYDSRNNSKLFSQVAAATLAANGVKVYLTRECMPTPYLSFLVRHYGTDMGINVTASHNPPQYNGYKVYDSEGCQLTDDAANEVTEFISQIDPFGSDIPAFCEGPLVVYADDAAEEAYKTAVLAESLESASGISVVYSPLNGAGHRIVPEVLRRAGVSNLSVVEEQSFPDGNFPTCPNPNPENGSALKPALKLAAEQNADAVVANDPDSDRLGVAVNTPQGFVQLSGNDVGVLLCDYILQCLEAQGKLPAKPVIVKTIVSTLMTDALAKKYGGEVVDVLTGFKYIGNAIKKLEDAGEESRFIFGFEESCGYLKGSYVRDKDGVVAAMLFCECVAHCKRQGKNLVERLAELRAELGAYTQSTLRYTFTGVEGTARKESIFEQLRATPIQTLGNSKVVKTCDYLTQKQFDLPRSNVLRYNSEDGSQLILRPSGTEPLIKCYIAVRGYGAEAEQKIAAIKSQIDKIM